MMAIRKALGPTMPLVFPIGGGRFNGPPCRPPLCRAPVGGSSLRAGLPPVCSASAHFASARAPRCPRLRTDPPTRGSRPRPTRSPRRPTLALPGPVPSDQIGPLARVAEQNIASAALNSTAITGCKTSRAPHATEPEGKFSRETFSRKFRNLQDYRLPWGPMWPGIQSKVASVILHYYTSKSAHVNLL